MPLIELVLLTIAVPPIRAEAWPSLNGDAHDVNRRWKQATPIHAESLGKGC